MLWPEGSASVVAGLGSYLQPELPDERVCSFCLSKAGSYLAMASKSVLALFRLKPLAPLAIYPAFFPETEIVQVAASARGNFLAVLTADNRVAVFSVQPQKDIEEVLKIDHVVTPGAGESIGARELWLEPLNTVLPEHSVVYIGTVGPLLVVYTEQHIYAVEWSEFQSKDPLKPPTLHALAVDYFEQNPAARLRSVTHGVWARDEWLACLTMADGEAVVLHFKGLGARSVLQKSAAVVPLGAVVAADYNFRMGKLALVTSSNRVFVVSDPLSPKLEPAELPLDGSARVSKVHWAPSGSVLLLMCGDGWLLVSALGLPLYHHQEKAVSGVEPVGVLHAEWLVNSDGLVLLDSRGQLLMHNVLRWSGNNGSERTRPLLHGNGRLLVYHSPPPRGIQAAAPAAGGIGGNQMWLTVPLPTWYMAQNWPLAHVCSSPDGRYVAVSGTAGIMLFSLASRQWKEVGDRDARVHGGLCWHGRRLVAAVQSADDGMHMLKMFSPVGISHSKTSSGGGASSHAAAPPRSTPASPDLAAPSQPHGTDPAGGGGRRLSAQDILGTSPQSGAGASGHAGAALTHLSALPSSTSVSGLGLGSTSEQQVIARDILGSGPGSAVTLLSKGPQNLLAVLVGDTARLLIYDLAHNEFDLVRDIPLAGVLPGTRPAPAVRALSLVDERRVLVLVGTSLVLVSSVDESRKYQRQIVAEPIETFTYLASEGLLCVFDGQEMVITTWPPPPAAATASSDAPAVSSDAEPKESKKYLASIPLDAYPVHISPARGVLALVEAEPIRSYDASFTVARPVMSQEVYIPYVLEAALVAAFERAVALAAKYSKMPYFSGVLETLLYRTVTNDDDSSGVRLALKLIAMFQNQEEVDLIVAGCARKVDVKYWPRLFDAVGRRPAELFDESLRRGELEAASEFLLVVQATEKQGTPELADAAGLAGLQLDGRTLDLYRAALAAGKVWICRELCEFLLAVDGTGGALRRLRELAA